MNKIKLFSILAFVVAIGLAFYLVYSIYVPMKEQERIQEEEAKVINKMQMIRKAQKAYLKENNVYAPDWKTLVDFVKNGVIYETQRKEQVFERDIAKAYLGDSVVITIDTLGALNARDKIFPKSEYPDFDPDRLPYVPGTDNKFKMEVSSITLGRADVSVIKVVDPKPINPRRDPEDDNRLNWPLQFGSLQEATTDGNWK